MAEVEQQVIQKYMSPIANPLVGGKLLSRTLKLLKKAQGAKALKRGVPDVTKAVRQGKKGIVVFAGDIYPVELIAHMPILCEENDVKYVFVNDRAELAAAMGSKRPVSCVMVLAPGADSPYEEVYNQCGTGILAVHPYMGSGVAAEVAIEAPKKKRAAEDNAEGAAEEPEKKKKKKKEE